jgi:hypothetical protein
MNIASNPWSFVESDIVSATPSASPNGLVMGAGRNVTLTTTGAHGLSAGNIATVFGSTNATYQGCYRILTVPTATTATMEPLSGAVYQDTTTLAASGGGTIALCLYPWQVRAEDIQWEIPAPGEALEIRDRNGNIIWQGTYPTSSTAPNWNRGKLMWVFGITPIHISAGGTGVLLVTVN